MTAADPTNPEHYVACAIGYKCRDCNASNSVGLAVRHTSTCDLAPQEYVIPSDQTPDEPSKGQRARGNFVNDLAARDSRSRATRLDRVARDAREGLAGLHSDSDLLEAVRSGRVSVADAMNSDC